MKQKISVSIDEKTVKKIEKKVVDGKYRNKSHFVEYAVNTLLENHDERRQE